MGLFRRKPRTLTLEAQLDALANCGVHLRDGFTVEDLLYSSPREEYEAMPFLLVLMVLGTECESDHRRGFLSDDIWNLDAECICDDGSYADIIKRLREISGGEFPAENIRDCVDLDKEQAWVQFDFDGAMHKFDAKVDNDWVDPQIFAWIDSLQRNRGTSRRLFCNEADGQNLLLGFATPKSLDLLRKKTGLQFDWMVR